MSHKVCWIPHYDVTWLIVLTWLRTRESSLHYDRLIVSWLTIVTSYDVMTFAHDSDCESWVSRMRLIWAHDLGYGLWLVNSMLRSDPYKSSEGFNTMTRYESWRLYNARWWVTRVRVVGRCLYEALGSDQGIKTSLLHLRGLKSQHHRKSWSLPPTYLSSPTMAIA